MCGDGKILIVSTVYSTKGRQFLKKQRLNRGKSNLKSTISPLVMINYFQPITAHVFSVTVGSLLSLFAIKMANIWQNRGALHGAQWRVPTNFIPYVFTLMLVLLSYHSFVSSSGPAFQKIAFNFRYVTLCTFQCLV